MAYEGEFMHFNDALEKGYSAQELISAVDIAYSANPEDKSLLSVVDRYQHRVLVSDAGFAVAKAIAKGETQPLKLKSMWLRDGGDGTEGAFAIMRPSDEKLNSAVTFKATSHGLSHGHFDKLTIAYYDAGNEVLTDYGAARFLNIEAKYNGHYTHENESWAKSSIAHNTLVVDGKNMFGGKWRVAQKYHPEVLWHSFEDGLQAVAAREENAYDGVAFTRYVVYADVPFLEYPLIMDVLKAESSSAHQYDYPLHYNGHMISLSVPYERALTSMEALGTSNGYQHIWTEAKARGGDGVTSYTWLTGYRMYTVSTATTPATEVYLCRSGASDPDFNLRSEPMYILREKGAGNHVFASCLETHGKYDLQIEQSANLVHSCKNVTVLSDDENGITVRYDFIGSHSVTLTVSPTEKAKVNYN